MCRESYRLLRRRLLLERRAARALSAGEHVRAAIDSVDISKPARLRRACMTVLLAPMAVRMHGHVPVTRCTATGMPAHTIACCVPADN